MASAKRPGDSVQTVFGLVMLTCMRPWSLDERHHGLQLVQAPIY